MRLPVTLSAVLWMTIALAAVAQDASVVVAPDFSEARLREGKEAFTAKRPVEAINLLQIAAFGFLDRPALLCESLVYLALAEQAAERKAETKATLERLSEVERRVPACGEARIDLSVRAEFETRFHRRLLAFPTASPTPHPKPSEPTPRPGG